MEGDIVQMGAFIGAGVACTGMGGAAVGVGAVMPILAITAMYALETLVSFIQAYVFTILTCVYLKDALHPTH